MEEQEQNEERGAGTRHVSFWQELWQDSRYSGIKGAVKVILFRSVLFGLLISAVFLCVTAYRHYYTSNIRISYVYPQISEGKYPDGKRFSMYDLLDNERVSEALDYMKSLQLFRDMTITDLQKGLSVSNYLSDPVQGKVENIRSLGRDFTYYGNEYAIVFHQPSRLNLGSPSSAFGLLAENYGPRFLDELVKANIEFMRRSHTDDGEAFVKLAQLEQVQGLDYDETGNYFAMKMSNVLDYIYARRDEASAFIAQGSGLSFSDLAVKFQTFMDSDIQNFINFVQASKLTGQLDQTISKNTVAIENNQLNFDKKNDEAEVNSYAMQHYDHTFTENLIVVALNQTDGLYQARPKTAYDTVVQQTLAARSEASRFAAANELTSKDITDYIRVTTSDAAEYARLKSAAAAMEKNIRENYEILIISVTRLMTRAFMDGRKRRDTIQSMSE